DPPYRHRHCAAGRLHARGRRPDAHRHRRHRPLDEPGGAAAVTELRFDDPCLIFALGRESKFFRREFKPNQAFPGAPCRARFCGPAWLPVLVVETGVGREATCRALDWLAGPPALDKVAYRPKLVLSAGFCGGLAPSLKVGDVVLAT